MTTRKRNKPVSFRDLDAEDWKATKHYEWAELKYDGHFARVEIAGKHWRIYSSTDRLVEEAELTSACKPTTFWAEHIRGTEWACRPARAELYERLAVFASPKLNGKAQAFPHSAVTRRAIGDWIAAPGADGPLDRLFLVDRFDAKDARRLWTEHVRKGDYEGLILGGPQGLARMKAQATYDYVCVGFEQSDADKYVGWGVRNVVGGLYIDGKLQQVTRVGGLTDEQRADFFKHPDSYVGRVFEAEGKKLFANGKLRHPNFLRWRTDKTPERCRPPKK